MRIEDDGLKKHYAITDPEHYRYFSVHIEADTEHAAAERDMLASHMNSENASGVYQSVQRALDALWEMLSGVCPSSRDRVCSIGA